MLIETGMEAEIYIYIYKERKQDWQNKQLKSVVTLNSEQVHNHM